MKKAIFTLPLLAGMASQAQAQQEGRFWIGGSLGMSSSNDDTQDVNGNEQSQKRNQYSILPELGYNFSDRWAAGVRLRVGQAKDEVEFLAENERDEYTSKEFSVAPFVRYTCLNWRKFSVFVDRGLRYTQFDTEQTDASIDYTYDITQNRYGVFLDPGFALRLSPCIALTGQLNFLDVHFEKGDQSRPEQYETDSKDFFANLNSPFNLGNFRVGFTFSF